MALKRVRCSVTWLIDTTDTNMGGKDPGKYPTKDNWVVGNTFEKNRAAITLGSVRL
jgi:hypothetical protein